MLRSLDVMLAFYGLERHGNNIVRSKNFKKRSKWWITKNNHNYRRITRILKSLRLAGLDEYADALCEELSQIYIVYSVISDETLGYWNPKGK